MNAGTWAAIIIGSPLGVYLLVRVASAAYFRSKADHETKGQHNAKR